MNYLAPFAIYHGYEIDTFGDGFTVSCYGEEIYFRDLDGAIDFIKKVEREEN